MGEDFACLPIWSKFGDLVRDLIAGATATSLVGSLGKLDSKMSNERVRGLFQTRFEERAWTLTVLVASHY